MNPETGLLKKTKGSNSAVKLLAAGALLIFITSPLYALIPVNLDKNNWYIKEGFSEAMTDPDFDPASDPAFIKKSGVPVRAVDIEKDKTKTLSTYTIITDFKAEPAMISHRASLGLFLPSIGQAWQVYLNGIKIADEYLVNADGTIQQSRFIRSCKINFSPALLRENNRITIRVTGDPRYFVTGLHLAPGYYIDDYDRIMRDKSELIIFMLMTLYLLVGLYHMLLFVRRPGDKYNLYYGLFSVGIFIYFFTRSDKVFDIFGDSDMIMLVEYIVLFTLFPLFTAFMETLFYAKVSRFNMGYSIFCLMCLAATLVSPQYVSSNIILYVWQASVLPVFIYILYIVIRALINKNREAPLLIVGLIVGIGTVTFDILDAAVFNTGMAFSKYGFFFFMMGIAVILANKFVNVYHEVEDLNVNLEQKVRDRTAELKLSLDEVNELRYRQDGDYYLTSLLVNPLGRIDVTGDNVIVSQISMQMKRFSFKNHTTEIGGDLNIATSVRLHGRTYTAFINCDAMGKSIQGAGGALVTGVIYKSFLNRTNIAETYRTRFPERWIKECFYDLQNVFLTFDGSMMISLVMGLIDDETGFVYYINAEHPWVSLYRGGTASFIENELSMHKLGVDLGYGRLKIKTFQMLPGDILFTGSDGRDDILIGTDSLGNRIINEDETLFLRQIEAGVGDVNRIADMITSAGELTDDLTLMSFEFRPGSDNAVMTSSADYRQIENAINEAKQSYAKGNMTEALSILRTARGRSGPHPDILKEIVRLYIKDRKYASASDTSAQFSNLCPDDIDFLYMTAYACKFSGALDTGIDYGERLRLRDPENPKNLMNLSELYMLSGNFPKALRILNECRSCGGSEELAVRLNARIVEAAEKAEQST